MSDSTSKCPNQMERIIGTIISKENDRVRGRFNDTKRFVIHTIDGKKVSALYKGFLPIETGYDIYAIGHYESMKNINIFIIDVKPFVTIPLDDEFIADYIYDRLRKYGFGNKDTSQLIAEMKKEAKDKSLPSFLTMMSEEYKKNGVTPNYNFSIKNKLFTILLESWNKLEERRLFLLGLTRTEIKESKMGMDQLYEQLLKNPFPVFNLTIEKCKEIVALQGKKILKTLSPEQREIGFLEIKDVYCGKILREVAAHFANKRTSVELRLVSDKYTDYDKIRDKLLSEYGITENEYNGKKYLTMTWYDKIEEYVSQFIVNMLKRDPNDFSTVDMDNSVRLKRRPIITTSDESLFIFDEHQKNAIEGALSSTISLITGGAGTGKTTVIAAITNEIKKRGYNTILCSYTGKAVSRMTEVINKPAFTIHRIINSAKDNNFRYIIIDEISMVTTELFYMLVSSYGHKFNLIFVGDENQLPPIEPGFLLKEILPFIPKFILQVNYRFLNKEKGIENNLMTILSGTGKIKDESNFRIMNPGIKSLLEQVMNFRDMGVDVEDFVVLSPFKDDTPVKGYKGLTINELIQDIYNPVSNSGPGKEIIDSEGSRFRIGDKVIMIKNCYEINVFNGEEGRILDIDEVRLEINVDFKSKGCHKFHYEFDRDQINDKDEVELKKLNTSVLKLSYMLTIHKSQGSEWKKVILFIDKPSSFLTRELLYTGASRPKEELIYVGEKSYINDGLRKNSFTGFNLLGYKISIRI